MRIGTTCGSHVALATALVVLTGAAGACSSSSDRTDEIFGSTPTPFATPTTTPTTTPTSPVLDLAGRAPLTGLPGGAAALDHAAVTVKISNTSDAHPHRGITDADLVFVEPIGVSATRIAAVYHSTLPDEVGPVRSLRVADAALIGPTHGVLANTMAAPDVLKYIDKVADVDNLGTQRVARSSGAYRLDNTRSDPHRVFAQPEQLLAVSDRRTPPPPHFSYGSSPAVVAAQAGAAPASTVRIDYSDITMSEWAYDPATATYKRSEGGEPHLDDDGVQVTATNVLVLRVEAGNAPIGRTRTFTIQLENASGDLTLMSGGKAIPGRWSKAGINDPFAFTTTDGKPLLLNPGKTWVELPQMEVPVTFG